MIHDPVAGNPNSRRNLRRLAVMGLALSVGPLDAKGLDLAIPVSYTTSDSVISLIAARANTPPSRAAIRHMQA